MTIQIDGISKALNESYSTAFQLIAVARSSAQRSEFRLQGYNVVNLTGGMGSYVGTRKS
jgi:hypothetical protein